MRKMKIYQHPGSHRKARGGFSIVEALTAVSIIGVTFTSLYTGLASGFAVIQLARENLRATQILQKKFETLRLYTWEQINSNGFIPTNFTAYYYPTTNIHESQGITYTGTVSIANSGWSESYATNLKIVQVEVEWDSGSQRRTRSMETLVGRKGLQAYVY